MIKQLVVPGVLLFLFIASILKSTEVTVVFDAVWEGPLITTVQGKIGGEPPPINSFSVSQRGRIVKDERSSS